MRHKMNMPKKAGSASRRHGQSARRGYCPRTFTTLATIFRESGLVLQSVFCLSLILLVYVISLTRGPNLNPYSIFSSINGALPSASIGSKSSSSSSLFSSPSSSSWSLSSIHDSTMKGSPKSRHHYNSSSSGSSSSVLRGSSTSGDSSSNSDRNGFNMFGNSSSGSSSSSSGSFTSWMSHNVGYAFNGLKKSVTTVTSKATISTSTIDPEIQKNCTDPSWCDIPMPSQSAFGFDAPTDIIRWQRARIAASKGEHVLLKEINNVIDAPFDFLDGDPNFRRHQFLVDVFVDEERWLAPITRTDRQYHTSQPPGSLSGKVGLKTDSYQRVPPPYNYSSANRAPIIQLGYSVINKNANSFFSGDMKGSISLSRKEFLKEWKEVKDDIYTPFIVMSLTDPDWGWLSSYAIGRTKDKGSCCKEEGDELLQEFLDDPKTLMLIVNQHSNFNHPKIMTLPRGLPTTWAHNTKQIFDCVRRIPTGAVKKDKLLMTIDSTWEARVDIIKTLKSKISPQDFEIVNIKSINPNANAKYLTRYPYYSKLASSKFGLAMPGIGYDTSRTWELLTMGTVVIAEKVPGLDRSYWRLPVLLVDDFAAVTTSMLRSSYVEAIYRARDFEFVRLKQSYWWTVIHEVSMSSSAESYLKKFPYKS